MDEKQLLVKVPVEFKKWLKTKAAELDKSMKDLVMESCEDYLKRYEVED